MGYKFNKLVLLISSILIFGGSYYLFLIGEIFSIPLLFMLGGCLFTIVFHFIKTKKIARGFLSVVFSVYISLPLGMSTGLLWTSYDSPVTNGFALFTDFYMPELLLGIFILIWTYDSFAYLTGSLIGKHKMIPKVSPKKSWEGFFGGMVFSLITSFILSKTLSLLSFGEWTGMAIIVAVFGTLGDLMESQVKRMADVKDSGNILPGHGGLLDRFDSFLMIIPFALTYIVFLASF